MDLGLEGKKAFVTGGSRGIGKSICECLEREGAIVISPERAKLDLSDECGVRNYINSEQCPDPDIFIHCAGVNELAGIEEITDDILTKCFQVNYFSAISLIKAFAGNMKIRHWGRIVFISSLYAIISRERRIAYSSSKNALNGLCKSLALELASDNILVNEVAPGYVMTDMTRKNLSNTEISDIEKKLPTGRFQETKEIADITVFLCSELNRSITGQHIAVDGGFLCQ